MPTEAGLAEAPGPRVFRDAMGVFTTGVAVISTELDGQPHGMTANSLTSVSLDPPLLLVCLDRRSRTAAAVLSTGGFVVNVLTRRQRHLADRFARPGRAHFADLPFVLTPDGLPALPGCAARFECAVDAAHPGGDHHIVVGRVLACRRSPESPLVFYRGRYHRLGGAGHDDVLAVS